MTIIQFLTGHSRVTYHIIYVYIYMYISMLTIYDNVSMYSASTMLTSVLNSADRQTVASLTTGKLLVAQES